MGLPGSVDMQKNNYIFIKLQKNFLVDNLTRRLWVFCGLFSQCGVCCG